MSLIAARHARRLQVQTLALGLMSRHGLRDWTFAFNRRKRALGLCRYASKTIELSIYLVDANTEIQRKCGVNSVTGVPQARWNMPNRSMNSPTKPFKPGRPMLAIVIKTMKKARTGTSAAIPPKSAIRRV